MEKLIIKCKKIYNKETPLKIEWVFAILLAVLFLIMFSYSDIRSLTIWSTNVLDCIADGDISQYYAYTALNKYNIPHQYVSGTLYSLIFWAIWNLPIWALQYFKGLSILSNPFIFVWSKLFLGFVLALTLYFTYKVSMFLFKDNKKSLWIVFLSFTFVYTYIGVFFSGQNDILICLFGLLSVYSLLTNKKLWFYICSAFAISIKYFFLFPYIALILLTEKKIHKIILKIFAGILPVIFFKILACNLPMYAISEKANYSQNILNGLFASGFSISNGFNLSLFFMSLIVTYFIAYITNLKDNPLKNNYIIYFSVVPFVLMFMFSTYYEHYRPILLMPSLMILYFFKPSYTRINIILDTLISISSFVSISMHDTSLFNAQMSMNNTVLTHVLNISEVNTFSLYNLFYNLFGNYSTVVTSLCTTIMFTGFMLIMIINYPTFKENKNIDNLKCERWIIWARTIVVVPAIFLSFANIILSKGGLL